ncbi:MAG: ATP-dependent Clp protease ATP-binding subunit [Clostridia bacterium]|nr:ATP-dependent Clp protease ATP-binding subunit [Clostridia bacterium]
MFMFTGFSNKANAALNSAVGCAEDMGHTYIGSEHILAGLLKDPTNVASVILGTKKINYQTFYEVIRMNIGVGFPTRLTEKDITPRAGRILRNAVSCAAADGSAVAGTEHILSAILKEPSCFASRALVKMGVAPSELYSEITRYFSDSEQVKRNTRLKEKNTASSRLSYLERYGRNLTAAAACGKLDPVTGRSREIDRVIKILCRRMKNNPCLIGEPGVGKTAVAEGLALRIASSEVPELLKNTELYSLELTSMVAGAKYRGDFEERIRNVVSEVISAGNIILFIDEIHNLIGAGSAEGAVDAANILKPVLARGEIKLIGATTLDEYRKNIEKDAALERRFQTVSVEEPDMAGALDILKNLRPRYEAFHRVKISDEALESAVELSSRYITDRFLPDKAIDLIDEASAGVSIAGDTPSPEVLELEKRAEKAGKEKILAVNSQNFEEAARLRDEEKKLLEMIRKEKSAVRETEMDLPAVTAENIAETVSSWTKIPVHSLRTGEKQKLRELEKLLGEKIIGQESAIRTVSSAVRRGRLGLSDPMKPGGTFLFCGPTGVGKTALAEALAEAVFTGRDSFIRLDMSEFSERHSVSRLIGSPPGYEGFSDGGQLVNKIRKNPYSVVLFDEIEKAHPEVFSFLLPLLDEGILTASDGKKADCRNCIIILTSNAGARLIGDGKVSLGFSGNGGDEDSLMIKASVRSELKKIFPPEFLNRIDETVIFSRLGKEEIREIAVRLLEETAKRLKNRGISADISPAVSSFIADKGYDKAYGARNLRRLIINEIETPLSELLFGDNEPEEVKIDVIDGKLRFLLTENKQIL